MVKNLPANAGDTWDTGSIPELGRSPGAGNYNPLQFLAWKIPWPQEPGGLWLIESQRVGHNWSDITCTQAIMRRSTAYFGFILPHKGTSIHLPSVPFFLGLLLLLSLISIHFFLAELGLQCFWQAFSSCVEWGLPCIAMYRLLLVVVSFVAEHRL